jgi:hypothetical protein
VDCGRDDDERRASIISVKLSARSRGQCRSAAVIQHLRDWISGRLRILRVLGAAGAQTVAGALLLQLMFGLVPVGFIFATSTVVGRVPAAVGHGVNSAEWRSLRNALLIAGGL